MRVSKRGQEGGSLRIVIGAVEVISGLKSSRCGPAPEKRKESEKRERNQEGGSIYQAVPFHLISSLFSQSKSGLGVENGSLLLR